MKNEDKMKNEDSQAPIEVPLFDPMTALKEENERLKKDLKMYKDLYNEYLDSTVKYRGAFKALLEEIRK